MGRLGVQAPAGLLQDGADLFQADVPAVFAEDLDEPAHVRALVAMGQVDVHVDPGHGVLGALELVQHHNGIGDVFHPHLVDVDGVGADVVLDVAQFRHREDRGWGFRGRHSFYPA